MPILTVFYIKLVLCLLLTVAILWTTNKQNLFAKWQRENDKLLFGIGFLAVRLLPFIGIFLLIGEDPRGDVPFFFYKAEAAKSGGFVYRDFWSYHAPLFSYVISLPLWIWHNARAIVLLMVSMETLILWMTYQYYKKKTENALQLTFVYWLLPAAFMYILIDGQEEVWFWGAALLMVAYARKHPQMYEAGIGVFFAMALLFIKVTFIFFLPPLLLIVRKPLKMVLVMAAIGLPVLGFLYWQIGDLFLMPIQHTEQLMTPNLFSVLRPFIELFVTINEKNSPMLNWVGLVFTLLIPSYMAWQHRKQHIIQLLPSLFVATFACMMLFQASAPGAYLIAYLMAVVFELIDLKNMWHMTVLLTINWLTVVQPFVYVYNKQPSYTDFSMFAVPVYLFEYLLQVISVLCYLWILRQSYRHIIRTNQSPAFA
ncbi:hypothetical protein [Arundinibacter roseus]|uniref:DUF2029 domain-containing protein n=1 Tax=Arundinibacter roseus TaxID=2070510 RepID=A0A4R4K309_9BACT|nr:hypothetical protein [Arundinibacter roseus]TDB60876.1 hypothetical protein EZE20_20755 [Arundinibacter roseus]